MEKETLILMHLFFGIVIGILIAIAVIAISSYKGKIIFSKTYAFHELNGECQKFVVESVREFLMEDDTETRVDDEKVLATIAAWNERYFKDGRSV